MPEQTRPCEYCGTSVTKTGKQASQRKYWTCGYSCANKLRIRLGNVAPSWSENPERGKQETRACVTCGTPVTRYLSQIRTKQAWSCSRTCAATAKAQREISAGTWQRPQKPRKGDTVPCRVCGTEFYRQPVYIKQGRFLCSRACNKAWQARNQTEKPCAHCKRPFTLRPSETAIKHCSRECEVAARTKMATGRMHNGRPVLMNGQGYLTVYEPGHPHASRSGRVLEHRVIVEKQIGRYLTREETINHIDHDRANNAVENLEILSPSDHGKETNAFTRRQRAEVLAELQAYRAKYGALTD